MGFRRGGRERGGSSRQQEPEHGETASEVNGGGHQNGRDVFWKIRHLNLACVLHWRAWGGVCGHGFVWKAEEGFGEQEKKHRDQEAAPDASRDVFLPGTALVLEKREVGVFEEGSQGTGFDDVGNVFGDRSVHRKGPLSALSRPSIQSGFPLVSPQPRMIPIACIQSIFFC